MPTDSERNAVSQALVLLAASLLLVIAISPLQLAFPRTGLMLTQLGAILLPALVFLRQEVPGPSERPALEADSRRRRRARPRHRADRVGRRGLPARAGLPRVGSRPGDRGVAASVGRRLAGPSRGGRGAARALRGDAVPRLPAGRVRTPRPGPRRAAHRGALRRLPSRPPHHVAGGVPGHRPPDARRAHRLDTGRGAGALRQQLHGGDGRLRADRAVRSRDGEPAGRVGGRVRNAGHVVLAPHRRGDARTVAAVGGAGRRHPVAGLVPESGGVRGRCFRPPSRDDGGAAAALRRPRVAHADLGRPHRPEKPLPLEPVVYRIARVSPDGLRIALDRGRPGSQDVWTFEVESETLRPLAPGGCRSILRSRSRMCSFRSTPQWTGQIRPFVDTANRVV